MFNLEIADEIERLLELYYKRWNKRIDETDIKCLPRSCTQEHLGVILRRIADTGDSLLTGYNWVRKQQEEYWNRVDWSVPYKSNEILPEVCPICGKEVRIVFCGSYNQSYCISCDTLGCLQIVSRGL